MKKQSLFLLLILTTLFTVISLAACSNTIGGGLSTTEESTTEESTTEKSTTEESTTEESTTEEIVEPLYVRVNASGQKDMTGRYIKFGSYPKTRVSNNDLQIVLTELAGTLPTNVDSQAWTVFDYYVNGEPIDFMWYQDVEYENEKYRGVYFTSYRPSGVIEGIDASASHQDENGYYINTVYWFKYEPLMWRILYASTGGTAIVQCENVIDCQPYYAANSSGNKITVEGNYIYPNNYEYSTIRKWLNETFYHLAFDEKEQAIILKTHVDNSINSADGGTMNTYLCNDTDDYVYLFSYKDLHNKDYGDIAKNKRSGTDYALCQGLYYSPSFLCRSPRYDEENMVLGVFGGSYRESYGYLSVRHNEGVCPTLTVQLIESTEHIHMEVTDDAVNPTCTATGLTAGSHCYVCGEILTEQESVEKTEHMMGEYEQCLLCKNYLLEFEEIEMNGKKGYEVVGINSNFDNVEEINIPSIYGRYAVVSIGKEAFDYCTSLTSITIPDSVTSIGDYAFSGCTGLTSITIPNSVTSIGERAFEDCTSLTNIEIPPSVTSIGSYAFYGCRSLTSITIPDSVTSIGSSAFIYCTSLTSITIPNSVTSIGEWAFYGCTSLTSITIPNSVTSIGEWAFYGCRSLTSVTIPDSVTSIGSSAFSGCSGLGSITVEDGNTVYHSSGNCLIETASGTLIVGCKNSVIPTNGSVTSIGEYAFYYCTSLTSITIPNSVTSIGYYAFFGCTSLESVTFADTTTWYRTTSSSYSDGTQTTVTNASTNATYLTNTYENCYWYKK